jgi:branched-chain amino acid transport system substrate-binding protein
MLAALGATGVVGPVLAGCGSSTRSSSSSGTNAITGPPVKIGLLYPQSGVYKSNGDDLGNGFMLYLKLHDNRLGGRPVNLIAVDEGETPESGKAGAERLLKQEGVLAMSGVVSSAVMGTIKPIVEQAQIPLVGSNASPSTLSSVRYIWRTSWSYNDPGRALGKYVAEHTNGTVSLIAADYQAGKDFVGGFTETFLPAKGQIEGSPIWTPFNPPTTDYTPYLTQIKNSGSKAVYCFYAGSAAVNFVKQYRALGLTQTLYSPGFITEGSTLKAEGQDAANIYTAMNYSADLDIPANRRFASEYQRVYNLAPSTYAMAAWDAANILDKAITLAGKELTPQSLNSAIGRVGQIDSPRGAWEFNQNRTPLQKWYLRQVRQDGLVLANTVISELTTL